MAIVPIHVKVLKPSAEAEDALAAVTKGVGVEPDRKLSQVAIFVLDSPTAAEARAVVAAQIKAVDPNSDYLFLSP